MAYKPYSPADMRRFREPRNGLDDFTNGLALLLGLDDEKAVRLAELIEDRIKELGDDRYAPRPDPWRD